MKLVHFSHESGERSWGALREDGLVEVVEHSPLAQVAVLPRRTGKVVSVETFLAPVEAVNIFGIGLNYRRHAEESGRPPPEYPMVFMKSTNAVQDPGKPIRLPQTEPACTQVDYEAELAVVIGRAAREVSEERALEHVLGFTVANDVSARDWQTQWGGGQFCQAKGFDTFCPLGPVLVTPEDLPGFASLRLQTRLNGELMQDSTTADLIFSVPRLIAFLSQGRTLLPGTVILTGTPEGVGMARRPPRFLQAGDEVAVEIEGIGILRNPVV